MIRDAVVYLGASVLNKAAPFLLLPLFTRFLTPEEFGALSIFLVLNGLFYAVIGMGIHTNVSKNFFSSSRDELAVLIGNIFFVLIFATILVFLLCIGISKVTENLLSIPGEVWLIFPLLSLLMMINTINLTLLRNERRPYVYALFEVCNTAFCLVVTVVLLVSYDYGWLSQVMGLLVANLIFSVFSLIYIHHKKYLKLGFDKNVVSSILRLSLPLIPHVLAGVSIAVSDRLFIEQMIGLEAVALYSIGYSFGMIVGLFTDAFVKAWTPWFFKSLRDPADDVKRGIVRYTYLYFIGVFVLAAAISFVSVLILPLVVAEPFIGASEYIYWVAIGCATQGIYKIFFPYLVHIGKTSFLAISTVISALFNLLCNYFFILEFGAIGAAYATILAYALSAALVFFYQKSRFEMPWALWRQPGGCRNGL